MGIVFGVLGLICFALGIVGIVMPILPTSPLLLIASACFVRSSPKLHRWFLQTNAYEKYLKEFLKNRAMRRKTKLIIVIPVTILLLFIFFKSDNFFVHITIIFAIIIKYYWFFIKIRTLPLH